MQLIGTCDLLAFTFRTYWEKRVTPRLCFGAGKARLLPRISLGLRLAAAICHVTFASDFCGYELDITGLRSLG
jgi:hypothetical protein